MTTVAEFSTATEVVLLSQADVVIGKMRDDYMPLKINGVDDAKGFKEVHAARMVVRNARVMTEKKREELKAASLEYGRKIDAEAKRIKALLEPVESHLQAEEDAYNAEKERIKKEAEAKRQAAIQARVDAFAKVGFAQPFAACAAMNDSEFADLLAVRTAAYEEEQARLAKEAAEKAEQERIAAEARAAEEKRLAEERAKLEAERKQLEEEQRKAREAQAAIDAEKARIEAAEREKARQAEVERQKAEAAERAAKETEARIKREQEEAKARAEREAREAEEARKREEALRPDREKILQYASLIEVIPEPQVSAASVAVMETIKGKVARLVKEIRKLAAGQTTS